MRLGRIHRSQPDLRVSLAVDGGKSQRAPVGRNGGRRCGEAGLVRGGHRESSYFDFQRLFAEMDEAHNGETSQKHRSEHPWQFFVPQPGSLRGTVSTAWSLQYDTRLANGLQALSAILVETAAQKSLDSLRCVPGDLGPIGLVPDYSLQHVRSSQSNKRALAREHLIQYCPKRENIAAPVDRPTNSLLGRHIRGGT